MSNIWKVVSNLGIKVESGSYSLDHKRLIFFNQVLFIGFFATLFQVAFVWPFIGSDALIFLLVGGVLLFSLWLNSKGQFAVSKWIYLTVIYSMAVLSTLFLGGSSLYHIQALLIFTSCLILFNHKTEYWQILFGIPFVIFCILIGEGDIVEVPDFSNHWWNTTARVGNIFSLITINTLLVNFIIRLNTKSERSLEEKVEARTAELSQQRNLLKEQNEEKVLLLKEVHHRVKNNLQVIVSLINMQRSKYDDNETQEALDEIQSRVHSMALVHEKMYQTTDFKNVSLVEYVNSILDNIGNIYEEDYKVTLDIPQDVGLTIETAVPAGLIINEIISNFFKHVAIPSKEEKSFHISFAREENGIQTLHYSDNGNGFPENYGEKDSGSLGILLIGTLAEQLEGEVKYYNDNGAVYRITMRGLG